jgi:hypothetical protein
VAANEGSRSEEGGTKRTVYAALAANLLIAAAKCQPCAHTQASICPLRNGCPVVPGASPSSEPSARSLYGASIGCILS